MTVLGKIDLEVFITTQSGLQPAKTTGGNQIFAVNSGGCLLCRFAAPKVYAEYDLLGVFESQGLCGQLVGDHLDSKTQRCIKLLPEQEQERLFSGHGKVVQTHSACTPELLCRRTASHWALP
jgi:hypothetical protein